MEQNQRQNEYIEKKVFIFSVFLLVTLMFTSIFMIYFILKGQIAENNSFFENDVPTVNDSIEDSTEEILCSYTIKVYNGKIGVYENESLIYTLDKYVFTLPENDKILLKKGIMVKNKAELYEILEEYSK